MSSSRAGPSAAFILPPDILEQVYGAAGVAEVNSTAGLVHDPISPGELEPGQHGWTSEVELLFTSWQAPVLDEVMLARFPRLRVVFYGAGSVRRMVTPAFWRRGIRLTTAASANAVPVAEYTLAVTLMGLKRLWPHAQRTRRLRSFDRGLDEPEGAFHSRVGLISLGTIGRLVRERLRPFDLEVCAHDPFVPPAEAAELGVELLPLADLFDRCSVVSLHAPRLPATIGMIGGDLIARLRPHATFINTSRGALVKEDELCEVLRGRPDIQVVLDVTDPEPPHPDSPLYTLPNVMLTPHIAGSRGRERRRLGECMLAEFSRFWRGDPLVFEVSEAQARIMA